MPKTPCGVKTSYVGLGVSGFRSSKRVLKNPFLLVVSGFRVPLPRVLRFRAEREAGSRVRSASARL